MATNGGRIEFQVGLNVETESIQNLKTTLQNLQKIRPVDFSGSREELKEVQKTAAQVEEALKKAFNTNLGSLNVGKFNTELQQVTGGLDGIYRQFSKLGGQGQTAFSEIAKTALTSNFQLKETNSLIQQMGTTLVNTIKWNIASSAINGFTQEIQSAFTYVKSLDAALTDIRIVTGDSQQKMQQFAASANKAAQSLGRSTMDYTKSALTFYQQGLSDEDVQARTEAVLKAQNITGTGSEMADYMTAVWNGYKVANEEAELYVDKLAAVADSSASDMSQLAIAMSRVASTANNMGVDIDQLNAQIATVVATTRQAPESVGTAFKTIYTRLNDIKTGADEAEISLGNYSGKMASIGFNVLDTNGRLRDTGQIMEEIGERWQTLTKEQQIYLASTMGGQKQVNQLMALFNSWTTYSDLLNVSLESEGTLAEKNSRYMESLGAKMNQLAAAQQHVKSAMVDTDSWKAVLEILTAITDLFGTFVDSIGGGGTALLAFGSILMQVFSGPISQQLNNIITNLQKVKENAQMKEEDIAMTKLFAQSQGYKHNQATQAMVDAKQEIHKYYSFISAEEANAYNQIVKQIGATKQQVEQTENLQKKVQAFQDGITAAGNKVGTSFTTALIQAVDVTEELSEKIKNVSIRDFQNNPTGGTTFYKELLQQLESVIGTSNKAIPALSTLQELVRKGSTDFGALQVAARNALGQTQNLLNKDVQEVNASVKEAQANFELVNRNKQRFLNGMESQVFARSIIESVSAVGRLAASFQSLGNIIDTVFDSNVSAGDKIIRTLTSIGFSLPMIVSSYGQLKTIIYEITLAEKVRSAEIAKSTALKQKDMATQAAKAAREKANILAKEAETAKIAAVEAIQREINEKSLATTEARIKAVNAAKLSSVTVTNAETAATLAEKTAAEAQATARLKQAAAKEAVAAANKAMQTTTIVAGVVLAGIGLAIKGYEQYKKSIEQAEQAAKNFAETQKTIVQNNANNNKTISELEALRKEYDELSKKAGTFDSTFSNLTDSEKQRWNQIKNQIVEANPSILAAYDEQHQAIINNNNALDETIQKLKEKHKYDMQEWVTGEDFKKARQGRENRYTQVLKEQENLNTNPLTGEGFYEGSSGSSFLSSLYQSRNRFSDGIVSQIQELNSLIYETPLDELGSNAKEYQEKFNNILKTLEESSEIRQAFGEFTDEKGNKKVELIEVLKASFEAQLEGAQEIAGQDAAIKTKLQALGDANVFAIASQLMYNSADNGQYQALKEQLKENGSDIAETLLTAWLEGNKQGQVLNEAELKEKGKAYLQSLSAFLEQNPEAIEQIQQKSDEYKKQVFKTAQDRINYIAEAVSQLAKTFKINESNQDVFLNIINSLFGLNLTGNNVDFSGEDKIVKSISSASVDAIDKARQQILAKTGKADSQISLQDLTKFGDNLDWSKIASEISKVTDWSKGWEAVLQRIIDKYNKIAQNQSLITSLSSITQTGQKLQSGKSVSAKDQTVYRQNLNTIIDQENTKGSSANQQLIADAELLKKTWLAGSEAYEQALTRVQKALIDTAVTQAELEGRPFTEEELANVQKYATTIERVQDLWNRGIIKNQIEYHALFNKALSSELKTLKVTPDAFKKYTQQLKKNKNMLKASNKQLDEHVERTQLTDEAITKLALNNIKTTQSLQELQKTFKSFKYSKEDLLAWDENGTMPQGVAQDIANMVATLNHIPGLDITDNDFIKYFDEIKAAAQGTEGAFQNLQKKLALDDFQGIRQGIKIPVDVDEKTANDLLDTVNNIIQGLTPESIQTYAYLNDSNFVNALNQLIMDSVITADQVQAILSNLGVKANVKYKRVQVASGATQLDAGGGEVPIFQDQQIIDTIEYQPIRSGGGGLGDGGHSGGGGGGGGGSKGKTLSKKDQKKEDLDPYHDINRQLERINKQYSLLEKNEEKLIGTDLIDNLTDQNKLLDRNIDLLHQKYDIGEEERKKKAEKIAPLGVEFDERGEITNYNEIRQKLLDEYNALIKEWNELAEAGTALPEEERKKKEEDLKEAQKKYEENKKNIDDYLEHLDTQADVQLQIKDEEEKKIQNEIKKFKIKIDLHIDYSEALRDWRDFEDKVIDQLRDDDIFGNIESRFKNIFTYFDEDDIGKSLVGDLTDQVNGTLDQIEKMKNGVSQIYGNNMAQAMQDLDTYTKQLMSSLTSVKDLMEEIKQSFFDLVNKAQESFDEQTDEYEALASWIEHDRRLMELLYGDEAYEKFQKFDQKQAETNLKQLDFYQKQKDFWWEQMEVQKARMDQLDKQSNAYKEAEERFKELEKHWLDTAKTLNSTIEDSIDNLIVKYENTINKIFGDLDKKLTDDKGLDPLAEEWELINKEADQYLDDVNALFEIEKLGDAYKDALKANEGNAKVQNSLNKMMNEQLGMLKDKDKLTQYDVDRANKLLEIELKRIALEEARQNKTRLRLKRDSQGNYSYQFTADEEETDSRRQELAAARNELYNMDKQQYKNNLDEIIALTQQAMDRIKQLYLEGKDDQAQALAARYNNIIGNLTDQNGDIKDNLQDSAFDELSDLYDKNKQEFLDMSDAEKDQLMNGLVPQWDSGVQAMSDKFAGNGGFLPTCQDAFAQLADATKEYKDDLQDLQDAAQINFDEITAGINDTAEKTETLLEDNQDLIEVYEDEFETMEGVIDQLKGLAETYEEVRNAAIQAAQAALKLKQAAAMDPQSYSNKDNNENSEALEDGILVVKKDAPQYQGIRTKIAAVRQDDENYYYRDPSKGSSSSSGSSSAGPGTSSNSNSSTVYIPKKKVRRIVRGSTGMYTGSWGDEGRLAILHEKELVLNKDDTANILAAVSLMRHINASLNPALSNFNIPSLSSTSSNTTSVDQQVHIQASFPNVQDRNEIEQAFNNLINRASQYAFNTDR